ENPMTNNDRHAFASQLALLAEVFDHPVTELVAETYFQLLEHFELDETERAIVMVMKTSRFFPRPVELLDYCREIRAVRRAALDMVAREQRALPADSPEAVSEAREQFAALVDQLARRFIAPARRSTLRPVAEMEAEVAQLR